MERERKKSARCGQTSPSALLLLSSSSFVCPSHLWVGPTPTCSWSIVFIHGNFTRTSTYNATAFSSKWERVAIGSSPPDDDDFPLPSADDDDDDDDDDESDDIDAVVTEMSVSKPALSWRMRVDNLVRGKRWERVSGRDRKLLSLRNAREQGGKKENKSKVALREERASNGFTSTVNLFWPDTQHASMPSILSLSSGMSLSCFLLFSVSFQPDIQMSEMRARFDSFNSLHVRIVTHVQPL